MLFEPLVVVALVVLEVVLAAVACLPFFAVRISFCNIWLRNLGIAPGFDSGLDVNSTVFVFSIEILIFVRYIGKIFFIF